jgi:transcriptional regulator with AAA-type ATPase domain
VLPLSGVEARHAVLEVGESRVTARRLGPVGQLLVNGVPVQTAELAPGDELIVGEARLRVERRAARARPLERESASAEAPNEPAPAAGVDSRWLDVLDDLHAWSRGGALDKRGAMLGLLVEAFRLRGAALVQHRSPAGVATLNAWGQVADALRDKRIEALLRRVAAGEDAATLSADELACVGLGRGSASIALVVVGGEPCGRALQPLRLALRFLAHECYRDAFREHEWLRPERPAVLTFSPGIVVGRSAAILRTYAELRQAAASRQPALLIGEPASGKTTLARLLHDSSAVATQPLLHFDGSTADSNALQRRLAALVAPMHRRQHAGTVLLTRLEALSDSCQLGLLGILDRLLERLDHGLPGPRLVATVNHQGDGARPPVLRRELYYRLAAFEIHVPGLRHRRDDIPLFFDHFLAAEKGPRRPAVAADALAALLASDWEGNLRELRHEAMRVAGRVAGEVIELADLSAAVRSSRWLPAGGKPDLVLAHSVRRVEQDLIAQALGRTGGRLSPAAELLGISRARLRRRIRELGIANPALSREQDTA